MISGLRECGERREGLLIDYKKYEFSTREKALFWTSLATASVILSMLCYGSPIFAFVPLLSHKKIKAYIQELLVSRRESRFLEEFKDFLFMLSTSVGAGRGITEGISESMNGIRDIYGKESLLYPELKQMERRLTAGKEDEILVLDDLGKRTGYQDVKDFVIICSICRSTGANMILALNKAASVIIDKMTIENEIKGIVKRKEKEGLLIFSMPGIVLVFLNIMAGEYIEPLYSTIAGRVLMTVVIAADAAIYGMIRKIVRVRI